MEEQLCPSDHLPTLSVAVRNGEEDLPATEITERGISYEYTLILRSFWATKAYFSGMTEPTDALEEQPASLPEIKRALGVLLRKRKEKDSKVDL